MPAYPEKLRSWIGGWSGQFLDLVYPSICAVCELPLRAGRSLCEPCSADLPIVREPFCQLCGEMFEGVIDQSFACPNCRDIAFSFEFARPVLVRDLRSLDLIHRLKYQKQLHLADELGRIGGRALDDERFSQPLAEAWPLVPVPLHPSRQRGRYFNQAQEIARVIARARGLPLVSALQRVLRTDTQTRLNRAQRLQNLKGAFVLTSAGRRCLDQKPAGAILVDDVLTTGSTVDACARTLRQAGFPRVCVVTVMRG